MAIRGLGDAHENMEVGDARRGFPRAKEGLSRTSVTVFRGGWGRSTVVNVVCICRPWLVLCFVVPNVGVICSGCSCLTGMLVKHEHLTNVEPRAGLWERAAVCSCVCRVADDYLRHKLATRVGARKFYDTPAPS